MAPTGFFSLKDEQATIRCVCFASTARKAGFVPRDGVSVVATGRLDYYEAQGHLQLYVDKLEPWVWVHSNCNYEH
ncbi:MAG: exodeoxyribonuclease VII large subunit [Phycisphaerales bacterium]|nr:exodeoxyribonuclease VII large subunit [Phycisphaerales bacterium]